MKGDLPHVDVPKGFGVTSSEVEQWKMERAAEKEMLKCVADGIAIFGAKVSPRNRLLMSLLRMLRNQG